MNDQNFSKKPPRFNDLRDTPFGSVTDSLKIAEEFEIDHKHILSSINNCIEELFIEPKFWLCISGQIN